MGSLAPLDAVTHRRPFCGGPPTARCPSSSGWGPHLRRAASAAEHMYQLVGVSGVARMLSKWVGGWREKGRRRGHPHSMNVVEVQVEI